MMGWLSAASRLIEFVRVTAETGWALSVIDVEKLLDNWKRFCALTYSLEDLHTPKRHIVWHMVLASGFLGNPRYYSNWTDKSLNRLLKSACRQQSQDTFEENVLIAKPSLLAST